MFEIEEQKIIYRDVDQVLGFVEFVYLDQNTIDIVATFVDPKKRGVGIGRILLDYVFSYFREHKIQVICSCSYAKKIYEEMIK